MKKNRKVGVINHQYESFAERNTTYLYQSFLISRFIIYLMITLRGDIKRAPAHGQFRSNYHFLLGNFSPWYGEMIDQFKILKFFQSTLQNYWVLVKKVSLTAYRWQLLDRGRKHKLKRLFCVVACFWGFGIEWKQKQ